MNDFGARQAVRDYYRGERVVGVFALGSLALLLAGSILLRWPGARRGFGIGLLLGFAVLGLGGGGYWLSLDGRERATLTALTENPPAFKQGEIERLRGVLSRFQVARAIDAGLVLAGLGALVFARKRPSHAAFGAVVALEALGLWFVETDNEARAERYLGALEHFEAVEKLGVDPNAYRSFQDFHDRLALAVQRDERDYVARCFRYPIEWGELSLAGRGDLLHHYEAIFSFARRRALSSGQVIDLPDGRQQRGGLILSRCAGEPGCAAGSIRASELPPGH